MNRRSFLATLGITGLSAAHFASPAAAAKVDRADFPDHYRAGQITLKLQGAGIGYYRSLIKGLAAGLYLDERAASTDVLADVAKRVEIEYFWALRSTTITAALAKALAENVNADALAAIQPQIDRVHAKIGDVKAGDRFAMTYLPGVGTWLTHNGTTIATAPGSEFAAAYFSIWFGDKPMDANLKRQLLGQ